MVLALEGDIFFIIFGVEVVLSRHATIVIVVRFVVSAFALLPAILMGTLHYSAIDAMGWLLPKV